MGRSGENSCRRGVVVAWVWCVFDSSEVEGTRRTSFVSIAGRRSSSKSGKVGGAFILATGYRWGTGIANRDDPFGDGSLDRSFRGVDHAAPGAGWSSCLSSFRTCLVAGRLLLLNARGDDFCFLLS